MTQLNEDFPTIIKVEGEVTYKDLEMWREIFETAKKDPDFVIFKDGYNIIAEDGYFSVKKREQQINIKITDEDMKLISEIKKEFFDNEVSNSTLGRILLRKGIQFYKKLKYFGGQGGI